jgi:FAD synthetase
MQELNLMSKVMAVGVFDLLHAGHLHYLEQSKALGNHLTVVVAHDETVRMRKHEPVTSMDLRRRMVEGLKPVDVAIIGLPPSESMFDILDDITPDIIALGYDQDHAEEWIKGELAKRGKSEIHVCRVEGLSEDLDGTRKIIARILELSTSQKKIDDNEGDN